MGYGLFIAVLLDADSTDVGLHAALSVEPAPDPLIDYFGGSAGLAFGMDDREGESRDYMRCIQGRDRIVIASMADEDAEEAMNLLRTSTLEAVKICMCHEPM